MSDVDSRETSQNVSFMSGCVFNYCDVTGHGGSNVTSWHGDLVAAKWPHLLELLIEMWPRVVIRWRQKPNTTDLSDCKNCRALYLWLERRRRRSRYCINSSSILHCQQWYQLCQVSRRHLMDYRRRRLLHAETVNMSDWRSVLFCKYCSGFFN